ncbi:MAG: universal stress protein [Sphingomonadales bacterium]|jgi:nucleotide-binding universal stress UspA family protein
MKTILLHIHDDDSQDGRLGIALDLAQAMGGHIACVQVTPVDALAGFGEAGPFGMTALLETMHDADRTQRLAVEQRLRRAGTSWDWRAFDGQVVETLVDQSRLADVLVLSQPQPRGQGDRPPLPVVGDVALYTRAPVLMVPHGQQRLGLDGNCMLAWNGSAEAAHALRLALPMLRRARCVHVVEVSDDQPGLPASDAATWLARQGMVAEVHEWPAKARRISVALLHAAQELDAQFMVMGAYGHSRLRETVLGGVTRELIQSATLPLLLAH